MKPLLERSSRRFISLWLMALFFAGFASFPSAAIAAPSLSTPMMKGLDGALIDRIEIEGVSTLDADTVEATLEVEAGEVPDELRVNRSARNLQAAYRAHGFEDAKVTVRLRKTKGDDGRPELVLVFAVNEGVPTRLAALRIVPRQLRDRKLQRYWERVEEELHNDFPLAVGDRFEQEKLAAARRAIQDALASEEFIGGSVEEVRTVGAKPAIQDDKQTPAKWVDLEFRIDLGERVTFGFRGNRAVPLFRLQALIDEQRLVGFGNDYLGTIRSRIEEEYRNQGYAMVKIETLTIENETRPERHATFLINEGPRVRIDSVMFEGNHVFTDEELQKQLLKHSPSPVTKGFYSEKGIETGITLLIEWMRSQGYLGAKFLTINRSYVKATNAYRLTVYLYEGERTLVQEVKLEGFHVIDGAEVRQILKIESGRPFDPFAFSEGLETLKQRYRALGYLDATIRNEAANDVVRYHQENRFADIRIEFEEGFQFRAGKIEILGLASTRPEVVLREIRFKEGDVLTERRLHDTESALRKLGLFSTVNLQMAEEPGALDRKRIRVVLQEGTPGVISGGAGYRTDLGARVFGQASYSNLFHRNHTILLNSSVNQRFDRFFCDNNREGDRADYHPDAKATPCDLEYQIQLGYLWPWFGFGETTFRPLLTVESVQYLQFDATNSSLGFTWERPLWKSLNLTGLFTYSLEFIRQFNAIDTLDEANITIGSVTPAIRVDLRDNPLAPTRGFFGTASFDFASPTFLLAGHATATKPRVGYTRFQLRSDYYVPVTRDVTWFVSFRTGFARNLQPPPAGTPLNDQPKYQIPLIKQFTLGGAGSVRGFSEQEINRSEEAIFGTLAYVNYRTQLDLPFSGPLHFGPFIDAGNVFVDRYSLGSLRWGTGVGFHYMSPVGPVNFDWGFKVKPRPGEERSSFYFSIGVL